MVRAAAAAAAASRLECKRHLDKDTAHGDAAVGGDGAVCVVEATVLDEAEAARLERPALLGETHIHNLAVRRKGVEDGTLRRVLRQAPHDQDGLSRRRQRVLLLLRRLLLLLLRPMLRQHEPGARRTLRAAPEHARRRAKLVISQSSQIQSS